DCKLSIYRREKNWLLCSPQARNLCGCATHYICVVQPAKQPNVGWCVPVQSTYDNSHRFPIQVMLVDIGHRRFSMLAIIKDARRKDICKLLGVGNAARLELSWS